MRINDLVPWRNRSRAIARRDEDEQPLNWWQREWQRDINALDEFFRGFDLAPFGEGAAGQFTPRVDVTESNQEIRVTAELPGLDEKDIDVSLTRDVLTIRGEKKSEKEDKGENYYRMERSYGSFQRAIPLPAEVVDSDNVDANYRNGVLTISLPKRPEARQQTKRITVKR
jgi:HSP20 family protein